MTTTEDLIVRSATITADPAPEDAAERTVRMLAVAWDTPEDIGFGVRESFTRGAIVPYDEDQGVLLRFEHHTTIGRVTSIEDTDDGALVTATIARTATGDEAYELVKSGVITRCSIGFRLSSSERSVIVNDDGTEAWNWTRAALIEVSLVSFPAHPSSTVTEVRKANTMTVITPATTDAELRASMDDMTREVAALRSDVEQLSTNPTGGLPLTYRSIGAYAHALAAGEDMATRAYEGGVLGDAIVRPEWLGVLTKRMAAKQPVTNMFTHTYDLPATGMTVEYGKHAESTVAVAKQETEGENLVTGKVKVTTASGKVVTYGGIGAMSFQELQRATVPLLDDLLSEQAVAYARAIETDTRAEFNRVVTAAEASPLATKAMSSATPAWWLGAVLDIIDAYDDTNYALTGLAVSADVFLHLATLAEERTALQIVGAPDNKVGSLTVNVPEADLYGLSVSRVPNWAGKHAVAYDTAAIRVKESPGAPLRLQQDAIVNLTRDFAVYGYASIFTPAEGAILALSLTD